ncbi:MAG TPA: hypothetical protein VHC95_12245 [Opitutales bacterium]|nr:hypothetical protein [Opitutales bacterium]
MPPAAQPAFDQGQQAAKDQKWELAIQNFQDARKIAPSAPEVLYNLGLAESKIPGRELRAIAWYGAYLSARPGAPDAAAVKDEIARLHVRNQAYLTLLIKSLQDAASEVSGSNAKLAAALTIVNAQAQTGDIAGAQKTAAQIRDAEVKGEAGSSIARAQAEAGDFTGLQKAIAQSTVASVKISLEIALALAQSDAGDAAGAKATFQIAIKAVESEAKPQNRGAGEAAIAKAQAQIGDSAGAQATILLALQSFPSIQDAMAKSMTLNSIVEAQILVGDLAGAQKTVAMLSSKFGWMAAPEVVVAQIKAGDIAGAQKTAELISESYYKIMAECEIAEAQAAAGDTPGAQATLQLAQKAAVEPANAISQDIGWQAIASVQLYLGDLAGAQKSIAQITDAQFKKSAESELAAARAQLAADAGKNVPPRRRTFLFLPPLTDGRPRLAPIAVSDWMRLLNGELNTALFPNLSDYLKTPPSGGSMKVFANLAENTRKAISAQSDIDWMLRMQARQQAKP